VDEEFTAFCRNYPFPSFANHLFFANFREQAVEPT
jgi:hypothetical protein